MASTGVTKVAELRRHVQDPRTVTVEDKDGTRWKFSILPVSMFLWDETAEWMQSMTKDHKDFLKKVEEAVRAPSQVVLRKVICNAVQEPKITMDADKDGVDIKDFMRHDLLVVNLYTEIVKLSFSGILKLEATDARSTTTSSR